MGAISRIRAVIVVALVGLLATSFMVVDANAEKSPYAETVIVNAKVITADSDDPEDVTMAEAIDRKSVV